MSKRNDKFFKEKKEWSFIKDQILSSYLKPYFQKILTTNKPVFYIDGFAGKGKFDDGNDGSPRIALGIRDEVLINSNAHNPSIESCFIDLYYSKDLSANLSDFDLYNQMVTVVQDDFNKIINPLLTHRKGQNIFLYIDPFGLDALEMDVLCGFSNQNFNSIEILLNANTFGFLRAGCSILGLVFKLDWDPDELLDPVDLLPENKFKTLDMLNKYAGGNYWQDILNDYYKDQSVSSMYNSEERFSQQYREKLKEAYRFVLDFPIRLSINHKPKYRLYHATNHEMGCNLMAENMYKRSKEVQVKHFNPNQLPLFTLDVYGKTVNQEEIKNNILSILKKTKLPYHFNDLTADFFGEFGVLCDWKQIEKSMKLLEENGSIIVRRNQKDKPTNTGSLNYFKETNTRKATILLKD